MVKLFGILLARWRNRHDLPTGIALMYVNDGLDFEYTLDMSSLTIEEIGNVIEFATDIIELRDEEMQLWEL